jgi:hypothetical protein
MCRGLFAGLQAAPTRASEHVPLFMLRLQATIPYGLESEDLELTRDLATGTVRFQLGPIHAICQASDPDFETFLTRNDGALGALIGAWYEAHLLDVAALDLVQEDLREEARLEMDRCAGFSYPPGHA